MNKTIFPTPEQLGLTQDQSYDKAVGQIYTRIIARDFGKFKPGYSLTRYKTRLTEDLKSSGYNLTETWESQTPLPNEPHWAISPN